MTFRDELVEAIWDRISKDIYTVKPATIAVVNKGTVTIFDKGEMVEADIKSVEAFSDVIKKTGQQTAKNTTFAVFKKGTNEVYVNYGFHKRKKDLLKQVEQEDHTAKAYYDRKFNKGK